MIRAMAWVASKEPEARAATEVTSNVSVSPFSTRQKPALSVRMAVAASLLDKRSPRAASSTVTSSSRSCGSVCMSPAGVFVNKFLQQQSRDGVERLENAFAFGGGGFEGRHAHVAIIQQIFHVFDRRDVWQIALVILENVRNRREIEFGAAHIFFEVGEAFDVFLHFVVLRIGDKNDSVDAAEHELAGGVVNDLAEHGVELELCFIALNCHCFDGKKIEKERAIGLGGQRDELPFFLGARDVRVDLFKVGGFPAQRRTVVNDLD